MLILCHCIFSHLLLFSFLLYPYICYLLIFLALEKALLLYFYFLEVILISEIASINLVYANLILWDCIQQSMLIEKYTSSLINSFSWMDLINESKQFKSFLYSNILHSNEYFPGISNISFMCFITSSGI